MQLKKGVVLTLTPIISALVVALSLAIWTFIFDQTRNNEIERAKLAIEVSMVDIRQWTSDLFAELNRVGDYENIIVDNRSLDGSSEAPLGSGFVQFSYFLNAQVPGIKEIMLFNPELSLLAHASENRLLNFQSSASDLSQDIHLQLGELINYMASRDLDSGIISYTVGTETELLAAKIFQPQTTSYEADIDEPQKLIAADAAGNLAALAIPDNIGSFELKPNGATNLAAIAETPTLVSEAVSGNTTYLFADSPLFYVSTEIETLAIISEMSGFSLTLIIFSLLLIFSLVLVVILIVNRQILLPIAELEHKIGLSMSTGVIDLKSSEERNEIEALGNRYLELMNKVARLANMDTLTQLPNRDQFLTSVANTLKHQPDNKFILFYLDLDRF